MSRSIRQFVTAAASLVALALAPHAAVAAEPSAAEARGLEDLVKLRCSTDPADEVIVWWSGVLYGLQDQQAPRPVLGFEGYNICRAEAQADGTWRLLTRELTFYRDLATGQIVDEGRTHNQGPPHGVHVANIRSTPVQGRRHADPWVESGTEDGR